MGKQINIDLNDMKGGARVRIVDPPKRFVGLHAHS